MRVTLRKDIIIPKGTVMKDVGGMTSHYGAGMFSHLIGLTPDTHGEFFYGVGDGLGGLEDERLSEWFEVEK